MTLTNTQKVAIKRILKRTNIAAGYVEDALEGLNLAHKRVIKCSILATENFHLMLGEFKTLDAKIANAIKDIERIFEELEKVEDRAARYGGIDLKKGANDEEEEDETCEREP